MELSKKNWNTILNNFIAGVTLVLATMFLALCFVSPYSNVSAISKEDIKAYNIHFVSALTKSRSAKGLNRVQLVGNTSNNTDYDFFAYEYDYNDFSTTKLYNGQSIDAITDTLNGNVSISTGTSSNNTNDYLYSQITSNQYSTSTTGYIPYEANYYENTNGQLEKIFYNEFEDGEYVLLNNYTAHTNNSNFNVENLYLSFGTPYIDNQESTPLYSLRVEAKLYSGNKVHNLALNNVLDTNIGDNKYVEYWNQYLDLRTLNAKKTADPSSDTYAVEEQQGKYVFTFYFIRYDENLNPVSDNEESFTYSFYLLDSADYSDYPTIYGAELLTDTGSLPENTTNEYFYNFSGEKPYINYDPTKYNLSYSRTNNKSVNNIAENITSTYTEGSYTKDGLNYPKGIITYYNGSNIIKQVFVLTHYNEDKTMLEHLYLSRTNPSSDSSLNPTEYDVFMSLLDSDILDFEYKITSILTNNSNEYTTSTYKTTTYSNLEFLTDNVSRLVIKSDNTFVAYNSDNDEITTFDSLEETYIVRNDSNVISVNGNNVAQFGTYPKTENLVNDITSGVIINNSTLETASSIDSTNAQYTLTNVDDTFTLTKTYINGSNTQVDEKIDIQVATAPLNELITVKFDSNNQISINYIVSETTLADGETIVREISYMNFDIKTKVSISSFSDDCNQVILDDIIDLDNKQLQLDFTYNLEFDDLGIYNFTYSYVCNAETFVADSKVDNVNYTTPVNYSAEKLNTTTGSTTSSTSTLYAVVSSQIKNSEATINGTTFVYNSADSTITEKNTSNTYSFNTEYLTTVVNDSYVTSEISTIYNVDLVAGNYILYATYEIGTVTTTTTQENTTYSLKGLSNYRVVTDNIKTSAYNLNITSDCLPNSSNWSNLKEALESIESYTLDINNHYEIITKDVTISETNQGVDCLHIYGSITYFNRADSYTDSNYAKLEQVDNKLNVNYISDVTSLYVNKNATQNYVTTSNVKASEFKGKIASLLTENQMIVTDVTPVLWNNFSTLYYINSNKTATSYIFRYTNYNVVGGLIVPDQNSLVSSTYSKDVYCQLDGLYEIVVFYQYDNLPAPYCNYVYYQLFTFIIDNSSPEISIEVENDNGEYEELGLNKYTNKNVRISWQVPTYFQNDVYIDISKNYYNTSNTAYNFNATYKQNSILVNSGESNYVNGSTNMSTITKELDDGTTANFYCVDLKVKDLNSTYNLNGNYKITVHYSNNGKSTYTDEFVIDKQNISGLTIKSVTKNADSTYSVDPAIDFGTSQIINSDFTFRFDRKESNANIFVYYDKIELSSSSDFDKIIETADGEYGITTKYNVDGISENISIGTPYVYEYTHEDNENNVASKNLLSSNTSCIYLFRLEDEAGNQARFIIFYDKTEPRLLTVPEPADETHIVNDTTRVVWGDYKAIKVHADENFDILNSEAVTNYSKENDTELSLVLRYLNSTNNSSYFNNLKVEKINNEYYILVPVTSMSIQDNEYGYNYSLNLETTNTSTKDYYFFPADPVSDNTITLPVYNDDGSAQYENEKLVKKTYTLASSPVYTTIKDYSGTDVRRYVTITYYTDNTQTTTNTITGSIGEGTFIYSVNDKLGNKTAGLIWMNLDKTQTLAYGIFDYTDKLENAEPLISTTGTYSASKMFISSLTSTNDEAIPDYTVTYKHYAYDSSLYSDYKVTNIQLEENGLEKTLVLALVNKNDSTITKTVDVQLTDEDGNEYPRYSYPYSLEGNAIVADTKGNPVDIYTEGSQYLNNDDTRKYSLALNTTTDTSRQKIVTEEGLYIFKRTYTDQNIDEETLGTDSRIIYRVYYVDRSGIINISTSNSVASNFYNVGEDINYILGSSYSDTTYQKVVTAKTIQNNQTAVVSSTSNSNYSSSNLFDTNKIQVQFNLTYDKYNFNNFIKTYQNTYTSVNAEYADVLIDRLFNQSYFENNYKIELALNVGNSIIFDESDNYFSTGGINTYLKNSAELNNYLNTNGKRLNYYNFFLDTVNSYKLAINDQAGYIKFNSDGTIDDANYLSNNLSMTFNISHTAPEGNLYGKYYGRHNYDENLSDTDTPLNTSSIPYENGSYAILNYLEQGQLEHLSSGNISTLNDENGNYVKLYSTNNETMIFVFSITNNEYQAQIDPNNIKIYKGTIADSNLIFNRVDGNNISTSLVSRDRQSKAFVVDEIDGVTYYAIIIFDNNLEQIIDADEQDYLQYRLLDPKDNPDKEDYFIQINYVGNAEDYIGLDNNSNQVSFFKTTYEVTVDRIKPTYNLTKLMSLDRYTYNTVTTTPTTSNFETVFDSYKNFYNFENDSNVDFERSDLENYFFALDTRDSSSFVFESVSNLDNDGNIYIRQVDKNNYKFSLTPDDYAAYYNAVYLQGHPQFAPSSATTITKETFTSMELNKYYRVQFSLDGDGSDGIKASFLKDYGIFAENGYYEIIEEDEAGNYRVYGVYIPEQASNRVVYTYQTNSDESSTQTVTMSHGNTPYVESSGMALEFASIQTKDNYLRATINVVTNRIDHNIDVIFDPVTLTVKVINRTLQTEMWTTNVGTKDKSGFTNTQEFINSINEVLDKYYTWINTKNHEYYSEYGYNIYIQVVDRIGVNIKNSSSLYNYEIDYVVAGSTLSPTFNNFVGYFEMSLGGQVGSTYLTDITVYKFNKSWTQINSDNSSPVQIFDKSVEELKKEITYKFTRGVYKFVFTDNFNRVNEFFYEYGISSSQTGGNLSFEGNYQTNEDGYTYSASDIVYTYDSSVYNVYIKFVGTVINEFTENGYETISDNQNYIVYDSSNSYSDDYLKLYGIEVITTGNTTTITFSGAKNISGNGTANLSQYHIKTILASTSTNYTWNSEETNSNIFVYDKKIAHYVALPSVSIKNLSGNTLDTTEKLNLTEDFELVTAWDSAIPTNERIDFNSRIILTRKYNDNGVVKTVTSQVYSGIIISNPGEYTAYVINNLGMRSNTISFIRGEGEISMYAVYGVDTTLSTETKLTASSMVGTETVEEESKVLFTYFVTDDYFSYKDTANSDEVITFENFGNYIDSETLANDFVTNTSANKYIDVRVNSNLSIKSEVCEVGMFEYGTFEYPYVKYQIYSKSKSDEIYVYRFVQIVFVSAEDTKFANTTVYNAGASNVNLAQNSSSITSTASSIYLKLEFGDEYGLYVPYGDTLILERYYNGTLVETKNIDITANLTEIPSYIYTTSEVGLHEFVLKDLAGRVHSFKGSNKLQIYLINEILFNVNDKTPVNNQIFNGSVDIDVIFNLSGMHLYNERSLNIVITRNGQVSNIPNNNGEFTLTEPGYYSITMSATTSLVDGTSPTVYSTYNFVIVDTEIATSSFSVSKGTQFTIDKLIKIINNEETDITDTYSVSSQSNSNVLLWLTHEEQGNSIFLVTLKYFDTVTNSYNTFDFRVWINKETPVLISSINAGEKTKETITINYNPGLIYTQIGRGYITVNDEVVATIDSTSSQVVDTISISKAGTYWIRVYSDDGTLISSYKFTKSEPMNNITKFILIGVVIATVVIVALFFFLRRKGRYR